MEQIFAGNGCDSAEKLFAHPHFLEVLHYLEGPDLPERVARDFRSAVIDCGTATSGDLTPLGKLARRLAREQGLNGRDAAEEFHMLALECGRSSDNAISIRDSVRSLR